jgi:hypothetical protein
MADRSTIGCTGRIFVATRGDGGAGEVLLSINGGTEGYLAWSQQPLAKGVRVTVVGVRGARTVEVVPTEELTPSTPATPNPES